MGGVDSLTVGGIAYSVALEISCVQGCDERFGDTKKG
jgi:hypothetical protein